MSLVKIKRKGIKMQITIYYNQGQNRYGAELYVYGTEKVNIYFTGDAQITYFIRMMKPMFPITILFHPTITDVSRVYIAELIAKA